MIKVPITAKTVASLKAAASPGYSAGGQNEAVFHSIFDTDTYVSGTTTLLNFFNTTRATPLLTNFAGRGAFPAKEAFMPIALTVDLLVPPSATAINDMWALLYGTGVAGSGAPAVNITYANKQYGPFPLSLAHGSGGITGFTTVTNTSYANNAVPDGGIWLGDSVIFSSQQQFEIGIRWDAALTLAANFNIKVNIFGVLHRAVL